MKHPLISYLEDELTRMKARNASYSLRAFARRLNVNPSALSEVMNGRRLPTLRFGIRVAGALNLTVSEKAKILESLPNKNTSSRQRAMTSAASYTQLDHDQYEVISKWYYFAILSLAETRGAKSEPTWVSSRLGIKSTEAATVMDRLVRLGLLKTANGKLKATGKQFATTSGLVNPAIRRAHLANIDLIDRALNTIPLEDQDFGTMTIATSRSKLVEAKDKIRAFRRDLTSFLESGPKDEVYNLSIFLFPLTTKKSSKGEPIQ